MPVEPPTLDPYYEKLVAFLNVSNHETERGQVLVAASLIEQLLEETLKNFLLELKEASRLFDTPNAPLSTLAAKSLMAFSLCLISREEFKDLEIVRKVRNEFAHSVFCSFKDGKIADLSNNLKTGMSCCDLEEPKILGKQRFQMSSTSLVTNLYGRAYYAKNHKRDLSDLPPEDDPPSARTEHLFL